MFIFECPFCGQRLECDDAMDGQTVPCPACGQEIVPVPPNSRVVITQKKLKSIQASMAQRKAEQEKTEKSGKMKRLVEFLCKPRYIGKPPKPKEEVAADKKQDDSFKPPKIAEFFDGSATLQVLIAIVMFLVGLFSNNGGATITTSFIVFCNAIFYYAIAKAIALLAKIVYNTDQMVKMMAEQKKSSVKS